MEENNEKMEVDEGIYLYLEGKKTEQDYHNEIKSVKRVKELIKDKKRGIEKLQKFDICKEMMYVVAQDCIKKLKISEKLEDLLIKCREKDTLEQYLKECIEQNIQKTNIGQKRIEFLCNYIEYSKYRESNNIIEQRAIEEFGVKRLPYDPDVALVSVYIYCKLFQKKYSDMKFDIKQNKSYKYEVCCCDEKNIKYRGDTMNSWNTTLSKFGKKYMKGYNVKKIPENYKSWENYLNSPEYYKNPVPDYISSFMKVVYTIGNIVLVPGMPVDFNRKRNCKFKDYWDLTLLAIYEYYMGGTEGEWIRSLEEPVIEDWLKKSKEPKDQNGWNNFVEVNFMQPFVRKLGNNQYGAPYELWDHHFTGKVKPEEEWQFEQFFVNARVRILERGKLIAQALVDGKIKK